MPGMKNTIPLNGNHEREETQTEEPVVREITLTDKLNKKLLESFLQRINQNDGPLNNMPVQPQNGIESTEDDNDFS